MPLPIMPGPSRNDPAPPGVRLWPAPENGGLPVADKARPIRPDASGWVESSPPGWQAILRRPPNSGRPEPAARPPKGRLAVQSLASRFFSEPGRPALPVCRSQLSWGPVVHHPSAWQQDGTAARASSISGWVRPGQGDRFILAETPSRLGAGKTGCRSGQSVPSGGQPPARVVFHVFSEGGRCAFTRRRSNRCFQLKRRVKTPSPADICPSLKLGERPTGFSHGVNGKFRCACLEKITGFRSYFLLCGESKTLSVANLVWIFLQRLSQSAQLDSHCSPDKSLFATGKSSFNPVNSRFAPFLSPHFK